MTDLAKAILARLQELGWQQKTLAIEWNRKVGKKSPSTFESRVSKLLNDEDDGYAFVLDGPDSPKQLAALAVCLGWTAEDLRARCEAARRRPTLVLEPRLPEEQRAFFEKRAEMFPGTLRCVHPNGASGDASPRDALRDLAKKYRNSLVIVPDDRDRDFLEGAGLRTSRVEPARPGFRVVALPDIFPQLPARSQDADGMQMLPDADVERRYRDRMGYGWGDSGKRWGQRIKEADDEGTPVTFRLDWLLEERGGRAPAAHALASLALSMATAGIVGKEGRGRQEPSRLDYLWLYQGRVLSLCTPDPERSPRTVAGHVPVHPVTTFEALVAALRRICESLNPYGEGGAFDLSAELDAFAQETGITLTIDTGDIRKAVSSLHEKGKMHAGADIKRAAELDARVHTMLDDLLSRQVVLPPAHATIVWALDAARRAPLLHVEGSGSQASVLADMGTGNVMRLEFTEFKGEKPMPLRLWGDDPRDMTTGTLDAGNIRLTWKRQFDENLAGSVLPAIVRRRKAAEEARSGDDD